MRHTVKSRKSNSKNPRQVESRPLANRNAAQKGNGKRAPKRTVFPVVGIGASAGGLEAFSELLRHLAADTGMAFVLIQHLAPRHESVLTEVLSKITNLPVREVKDGVTVEPNHVY